MKLINYATFFLKLIDQLYTEQSRAKYGPYLNLISYLPYILNVQILILTPNITKTKVTTIMIKLEIRIIFYHWKTLIPIND